MRAMTDLIFDFFGTLVDCSFESIRDGDRKAYEYFVAEHADIHFEEFQKKMGESYFELVMLAKANHKEFCYRDIARHFTRKTLNKELTEEQAFQFGRIHVDEWNTGVRFIEGMSEFIERLSEKYRLSIISNTHCPKLLMANVRAMNIEKHFEVIVTSIEHGMRKPHTSIFADTLSHLKTAPHQSVYIGDTYEDDFLGAQRAGMNAYLIDPQNKRPELNHKRVAHIFELEDRLKK
jgi:putative hydrolase of the HAD superfamily